MQFQFYTSGLAVYLVLRCKQQSEHPTGKCLVVLGRVILVDTPHFPFALSIFQGSKRRVNFSRMFVTVTRVGSGVPN
jgi:hypothetical protein